MLLTWIGTGPNKSISPDVLSNVLSPDQIRTISAHTGMSHDDLIATLSEQLPELINQLTPDGHSDGARGVTLDLGSCAFRKSITGV